MSVKAQRRWDLAKDDGQKRQYDTAVIKEM